MLTGAISYAFKQPDKEEPNKLSDKAPVFRRNLTGLDAHVNEIEEEPVTLPNLLPEARRHVRVLTDVATNGTDETSKRRVFLHHVESYA